MKGSMKVSIEITDEVGSFPITDKWTYEVDNTYETLEQWIDLFNRILAVVGFKGIELEEKE